MLEQVNIILICLFAASAAINSASDDLQSLVNKVRGRRSLWLLTIKWDVLSRGSGFFVGGTA